MRFSPIALCIFQLFCRGQVNLCSLSSFLTTDQPRGVIASDLNGDGWDDIAANNSLGITVHLNSGNGNFNAPYTITTTPAPYDVISADMNNDGRLDLVYTAGFNLKVMLADPGGGFHAPVTTTLSLSATALAAADLNGDGKADIVVSNKLTVFLGNGDGTFQPGVESNISFSRVIVSDFNNDGKPDVAGINANDVYIFLGTGTGTVGAASTYSAIAPSALTAHDLNNDGHKDLATSGHMGITVLLGSATGSLMAGTHYTTGIAASGIVAGDFDNDGLPDLATARYPNTIVSTLTILRGTGGGAFGSPISLDSGLWPLDLQTGDFDGDHAIDLVMTNFNDDAISTFFNCGTTGIDEEKDNLAAIFPNPCENILFLKTNAQTHFNYQVKDMFGRQLLSGSSSDTHAIDVHALAAGVYFLEAEWVHKPTILKFVRR